MKHEGESSLWMGLAKAFGDGLAFGVGVKIAQSSPRSRARLSEPAAESAVSTPVAPAEPLDLQVLSKVLAKIDAALSDHMSQVEQRLGAGEAALEARQAQQESKSQAALEDFHASLSGRIETVEQHLEERLRKYVEARAEELGRAIEQRLHRDITEAGDRTAKLLVDTIETRLLTRIAALEAEVHGQAETIRSLRAASTGSQQRVHDLLENVGRACQQAAAELVKPEAPASAAGGGEGEINPSAPESAAVGDRPKDTEPASEDRRFDSLKLVNYPPRTERKIPIPLVSSLAVFLLGVAALGSTAIR
jgi:hypothetical protein